MDGHEQDEEYPNLQLSGLELFTNIFSDESLDLHPTQTSNHHTNKDGSLGEAIISDTNSFNSTDLNFHDIIEMPDFNSVWDGQPSGSKGNNAYSDYHNQYEPNTTPGSDPVINIVAPEDSVKTEPGYGDNDLFPMYSAGGVPLNNYQSPPIKREESIGYSGDVQTPVSISPQDNNSRSNLVPIGTPVESLLHSPTQSSAGSPVISGSPLSPYTTAPFENDKLNSMSPLVGQDQKYFGEPDDPWDDFKLPKSSSVEPSMLVNSSGSIGLNFDSNQGAMSSLYSDTNSQEAQLDPMQLMFRQPYTGQSDTRLNTPHLSVPRRRERAHSDSWTPQDRDFFLANFDAQMKTSEPTKNDENVSFPAYQVNVQPHSPNISFTSNRSGNRVSIPGVAKTEPSRYTKQENLYNQEWNNKEEHRSDFAQKPHQLPNDSQSDNNSSLLLVPNQVRARSLSSPYEPTNEFKTSHMFSCDLCGKKFTRAYNLRSHMRTHTDERPFACQHCGKAFARQHDRKRHESLHSGQKKFTCYGMTQGLTWGCQKRFARADALGRHFRTEAGKACLRPVLDKIKANGTRKETAPEGILFNGFLNNKPQLFLSVPRRDPGASMTSEEREEQTRRTVIVTAVADHLQEMLEE